MKFRSTGSRRVLLRVKLVAGIAVLLVASSLIAGTPARAQGLFDEFEVSPRQVAHGIEDAGYTIRGPLVRRGDVYVCDAISERGRPVRLVVDARSGQVIERFAERRPAFDERDDIDAPPVPPRGIYGTPHRPVARDDPADAPDRVARGSVWDASPPNYDGATVIPGIGKPLPGPDIIEPKPRPHVVKRRSATPPVATAKAAPDVDSPAPSTTDAVAPVNTPAERVKPAPSVAAVAPGALVHVVPAVAPVTPESRKSTPEPVKPPTDAAKTADVNPADQVKPMSEVKPAPEVKPALQPKPAPQIKPVAEAKPVVEAKPLAETKPSPPHSEKKLNDLPVSPLD